MSKLRRNLYLQGTSGTLGGQLVYRTVNGNTVVSVVPVRRREASPAQKKQNRKFKYASIFARSAVADEVMGPIYAEASSRLNRFNGPYQLALTDYLRAPEIGDIEYESNVAGSPVLVEAFEDPTVAKVEVAVLDEARDELAVGEAIMTSNGIQWEYVLPVDVPEGGKLEVRAYDLPGNVQTKSFRIE